MSIDDREVLSADELAAVTDLIERCGLHVAAGVLGTGWRTLQKAVRGEPITSVCAAYIRDGLRGTAVTS